LLDLDHLGAELTQQRGRERAGDDLPGVDHPYPAQGALPALVAHRLLTPPT